MLFFSGSGEGWGYKVLTPVESARLHILESREELSEHVNLHYCTVQYSTVFVNPSQSRRSNECNDELPVHHSPIAVRSCTNYEECSKSFASQLD